MYRLFLRLLTTVAAGSALWAPAAWSADLLSIYREAVANDAVYSSARFNLDAGREKEPQGLAGLLPVVGATANTIANRATAMYSEPIFPEGPRFFNSSGYAINLTQPLFRWQNWETYQQSKLLVAQSEAAFAQAGQDLMVRTVQAYFDVLAAQDVLTVNQAQKAAIAEQLAQAKRNFEVGTSTIVDTNEAQSRYDLAVAAEIAAQNDVETKRTALQQIIGKPPGELAPLRTSVTLPPPQPAQMDQWVAASETNNYGVKALDAAAEAARRNVNVNRSGHLPTLDLVASRNIANATGGVTFDITSQVAQNTIGVQLAIPLFAGGSVNSKVREAQANYEKSKADLENQRRTAAQAARQSFLGVTSGLAQVRAYEAAMVSSQSSLDSNKLGYEVGVRINIDVLNAQQQLYQTAQSLAKARYDTIVNGFKLKAAAGSLAEEDLGAVNALLSR
jgi:outer membrane protein